MAAGVGAPLKVVVTGRWVMREGIREMKVMLYFESGRVNGRVSVLECERLL